MPHVNKLDTLSLRSNNFRTSSTSTARADAVPLPPPLLVILARFPRLRSVKIISPPGIKIVSPTSNEADLPMLHTIRHLSIIESEFGVALALVPFCPNLAMLSYDCLIGMKSVPRDDPWPALRELALQHINSASSLIDRQPPPRFGRVDRLSLGADVTDGIFTPSQARPVLALLSATQPGALVVRGSVRGRSVLTAGGTTWGEIAGIVPRLRSLEICMKTQDPRRLDELHSVFSETRLVWLRIQVVADGRLQEWLEQEQVADRMTSPVCEAIRLLDPRKFFSAVPSLRVLGIGDTMGVPMGFEGYVKPAIKWPSPAGGASAMASSKRSTRGEKKVRTRRHRWWWSEGTREGGPEMVEIWREDAESAREIIESPDFDAEKSLDVSTMLCSSIASPGKSQRWDHVGEWMGLVRADRGHAHELGGALVEVPRRVTPGIQSGQKKLFSIRACEATLDVHPERVWGLFFTSMMDSPACAKCGTVLSDDAKRCSGCRSARYCSDSCQNEHWVLHIFDCKIDKPIDPSHHLARACYLQTPPLHLPTRIDYGFEQVSRRGVPSGEEDLLSLYRLVLSKASLKDVRRWQRKGQLVHGIKSILEALPSEDREPAYSWFLANQSCLARSAVLVSDIPSPNLTPNIDDLFRVGSMRFDGTTPEDIKTMLCSCPLDGTRHVCFFFYLSVLSRIPAIPPLPTWVQFGFVAALSKAAQDAMGEAYTELAWACPFEDFFAAFEAGTMFSLFHRYNIVVSDARFFADVMSVPSSSGPKSVWYLKQHVDVVKERKMPVGWTGCAPLMAAYQIDYGYLNCHRPEDVGLLDDLYIRLFSKVEEGMDPMELHEACVERRLLEYVGRFVTVTPHAMRYASLLKNPQGVMKESDNLYNVRMVYDL
ncbi:uncharacterized protein BXZ73DRAFT_76049 [Epithele typhae]|uniref:uncharacterized protein n=1 Tax=Epithele typhae TaxID=378194 RepID=UPI00200813EA|nr:uncharacterized protein BXZ73DRAFT_76049 [Epithele typhae]KAH9939338.1 hypothetical protein BXZ73DRAFT_76049 [Epithele typhae]